jgi:hypothetical protein
MRAREYRKINRRPISYKRSLVVTTLLLSISTAFASGYDIDPTPISYNRHVGAYLEGNFGSGLGGLRYQTGVGISGFRGYGGSAAAGYQFNPYVGLEADFTGISAPNSSTVFMYGVTLRGILPIGDRVSLYAKLGGGPITLRVCDFVFNTGICVSQTEWGGLAGAGLTLALTKNLDLAVDYTGGFGTGYGIDGIYGVLGGGLLYHF